MLDKLAWSASFLNVIAMSSQLWHVLKTSDASGLSIWMLIIFLFVQITYAFVGLREKLWAQFWGLTASAVVTSTLIVLTFIY